MTAEQNYRLLQEIDANRRFLLLALQGNPKLLARAEERVRQALLAIPPSSAGGALEAVPPAFEVARRAKPGMTP